MRACVCVYVGAVYQSLIFTVCSHLERVSSFYRHLPAVILAACIKMAQRVINLTAPISQTRKEHTRMTTDTRLCLFVCVCCSSGDVSPLIRQ